MKQLHHTREKLGMNFSGNDLIHTTRMKTGYQINVKTLQRLVTYRTERELYVHEMNATTCGRTRLTLHRIFFCFSWNKSVRSDKNG